MIPVEPTLNRYPHARNIKEHALAALAPTNPAAGTKQDKTKQTKQHRTN
jgi:hypothetical protein